MAEYIRAGLPAAMENDEKAEWRLQELEMRMVMTIMDADTDIHHRMLMCGMNRHGIRWSRWIGLPHGKKIIVLDEDGDRYSFDAFDALAGETCELTGADEMILADIRASQEEPEDDMYTLYMPESRCG